MLMPAMPANSSECGDPSYDPDEDGMSSGDEEAANNTMAVAVGSAEVSNYLRPGNPTWNKCIPVTPL